MLELSALGPLPFPKIHRLWMTSHWLDLHKPGEKFRVLKLYQESSKTDKGYATSQAVIGKHMKVRELSHLICMQENWTLSGLTNFRYARWRHN